MDFAIALVSYPMAFSKPAGMALAPKPLARRSSLLVLATRSGGGMLREGWGERELGPTASIKPS